MKEHLADGTWLFAVADGIGGYEGGEVASALTVTTLREVVARTEGSLLERLAAAVAEANRRIVELQEAKSSELRAMGTTLTAIAVGADDEAAVAHIGDSRLYRLEGERLAALTQDHNVGTELVREGLIAPEALAHHPQRHMLTRALGAAEEARADLFTVPVAPGDVFLLMTDGMMDAVTEADAVAAVRRDEGEWTRVGPSLSALAQERHNSDDATVVAVRILGRTGADA